MQTKNDYDYVEGGWRQIKCSNCDKEISAASQFCRFCGTKLDNMLTKESNSNETSYFKRLYDGRLNRRNFITGLILIFVIFYVFLFAIGFVLGLTGMHNDSISGILYLISFIFLIIFGFSIAIRRLHDMGYSGWYTIACYIPLIGFIFSLMMIFQEGKNEKNKYGNVTEPKTNFYEIFGILN